MQTDDNDNKDGAPDDDRKGVMLANYGVLF